jgi:hypothetical protein
MVLWVVTACSSEKFEVSERHIVSIFTVEEKAKQITSKKQAQYSTMRMEGIYSLFSF